MTHYMLCVDPGKLTGVAFFDITDIANPTLVWSAEMQQFDFCTKAEEILSSVSVEVVCEVFKITAATGKLSDAPWSLEIQGTLRYLAEKYKASFTLQPPSRAKDFVPNDRLKSLSLWHKGGDGHARDALRHGVLYLVEQKNWRPANLLVSD